MVKSITKDASAINVVSYLGHQKVRVLDITVRTAAPLNFKLVKPATIVQSNAVGPLE